MRLRSQSPSAGGSGATTFEQLTDAASVDLRSVNDPLGDDLDQVAADLQQHATDIAAVNQELGGKANLLAPILLAANTNLTAGAHANRTSYIAGSVQGTIQADATSGANSDEIFALQAVQSASGTLVAGSGVTFLSTSGTSLNTATAVGGWIAVQRVPYDSAGSALASTYKAISPSISSAKTAYKPATLTTLVANAAANTEAGRIVVPIGAIPDGAVCRISGIATKTGTTVLEQVRVQVGANGAAYSGGGASTALVATIAAAQGWQPFELMIVRDGATIRGSNVTNVTPTINATTANTWSQAIDNDTTAFDIAVGNNASAVDASNDLRVVGFKLDVGAF